MTLSVVLFSSLFVALIINALITAEFMQLEENEMSQKTLIRYSAILGILGIVLVILGFSTNTDGFKGIGNLMVFFAVMLWIYKYYLARAQVYFMDVLLVKLRKQIQIAIELCIVWKKTLRILVLNNWSFNFFRYFE